MENQYKILASFNSNPMKATVWQTLENHKSTRLVKEIYFSPAEVWHKIRKVPRRKTPGPDGISNSAMKQSGKKVFLQLTHIYSSCTRLEYFPLPQKEATIVMIPKVGKNKKQPTSHRTISLLNSMLKILELLLLDHLRIITTPRPEQFRFRADHSTTTQLVNVIDKISKTLNR